MRQDVNSLEGSVVVQLDLAMNLALCGICEA